MAERPYGTDLDRAMAYARDAHEGQVDKQGQPYIDHPLRVAAAVTARSKRVAVLHDVVEDTDRTAGEVAQVLWLTRPEQIALLLVSRVPEGEPGRVTYAEFIEEIADAPGLAGQIAREVKAADIRDNLRRLTPELRGLEKRYRAALKVLAVGGLR